MTSSNLTTFFFIAGVVFLTISVIGQSQLGFAAINPGCFGRVLALIIGIFSLTVAVLLVSSPNEILDLLRTYLAKQIQQYLGLITVFL